MSIKYQPRWGGTSVIRCWLCVDCVLIVCWLCVDCVLVMCWLCVDYVLVRENQEQTLKCVNIFHIWGVWRIPIDNWLGITCGHQSEMKWRSGRKGNERKKWKEKKEVKESERKKCNVTDRQGYNVKFVLTTLCFRF